MRMNIKKILYLCSVYKPNVGGVEVTLEKITKLLHKKGVTTSILTKRFPPDLAEAEFINSSLVVRMRRPQNTTEYIRSVGFIKKYLDFLKPDLIHLIGTRRPMPLYGLLLSKFWRVPYVVTFSGGNIPEPNDWVANKIWEEGKEIVPQSIVQADKLTSFSKSTSLSVSRVIKEIKLRDIKVIYGAIDVLEIKSAPIHKERFPYFFSARRLDFSKGIDVLLRAFNKIKNRLPKVKLIIAGNGPERTFLLDMIDKLALGDRVVFLGEIPHREVVAYMKGAIAHICPSRFESGGLVNYEAQAAGCLAIGSNVGGIPEYIINNKTGLIFECCNVDNLASKLLLASTNNSEIKQIKKVARQKALKRSYDSFLNEYWSLYNNLKMHYRYVPFKPWSSLTSQLWLETNKI